MSDHHHDHHHDHAHRHEHDTPPRGGHSHHDHGHHGHSHAPKDFGPAFIIGIILNTAFLLAEIVFGFKANSLALLADAGHNASDVLGLFMAWGATMLAKQKPSGRYTYGLRSASILAALGNAVFLLLAIGGVTWEAIQRLMEPEASQGITVMAVAGVGILINGFTAWLFMAGQKDDLNVRGAFMHMASDAVISLGVVISGAIMLYTHWLWLDPVVSLLIGAVIVWGTWGLLKEALDLALHAAPRNIDPAKVKARLLGIDGVQDVHDLHIWGMSTTETAMSVHLLMPGGHPGDAFLKSLTHDIDHDFGIGHVTMQIELDDTSDTCGQIETCRPH